MEAAEPASLRIEIAKQDNTSELAQELADLLKTIFRDLVFDPDGSSTGFQPQLGVIRNSGQESLVSYSDKLRGTHG